MNKTDEFELGMMEPTRDRLIARIEALEAAGRRLAETMEWMNRKGGLGLDVHEHICVALAAWRVAEKGDGDE